MKRLLCTALLLALLGASAFAHKDEGDFPLTVHITAVDVEQGQRAVSGGGSTDSNGNYSSAVSGGGTYTWKLYTAQIEGDKKTYCSEHCRHALQGRQGTGDSHDGSKRGQLPLTRIDGCTSETIAGAGTKTGRWEIQFTDDKGKLAHQTFRIESEQIHTQSFRSYC